MGNLPASLPCATPLVSRFFAEMSKKPQRCAVVNLENVNVHLVNFWQVEVSSNHFELESVESVFAKGRKQTRVIVMRSQILLLLSCEIVNHLVEKTLRTDKQLINYAQNMNILFLFMYWYYVVDVGISCVNSISSWHFQW
jgi:hypothetical protein